MKRPNQAPEPTIISVTICADAQLAPAMIAAHLERSAETTIMRILLPLSIAVVIGGQGCTTMKDPVFWQAVAAGVNNQPYSPPPAAVAHQSRPVAVPSVSGMFRQLEGAKIVAQDGTFLGIISSNRYDAKSICNPYGDFGGKYSATSIFNPYGDYGSPYADYSPWNPYSRQPPLILAVDGTRYLLTKNATLGGIDPSIIKGLVESLRN